MLKIDFLSPVVPTNELAFHFVFPREDGAKRGNLLRGWNKSYSHLHSYYLENLSQQQEAAMRSGLPPPWVSGVGKERKGAV